MYERIIKNLTEGSGDLPSILQLTNENGVTQQKSKKDDYYDNRNVPFAVEFISGLSLTDFSISIQSIYKNIKNKKDVVLKLDFLKNNFSIFQIDDYSCQAMTMNNYDYFIKLFVESNGEKYKISSKAIFIIKSYLQKKAWIILDKTAIPSKFSNPTYSCIVDFTYKIFKDETTNKTKFLALNNYSNIQNLFNDPQTASPYYDKFFIDEPGTYSVLNLQNKYFLYSLNDNLEKKSTFNKAISKINKISLNTENKVVTEENEIGNLINSDRFNVKYLTTLSGTKYLNSAAYEVYSYSSNSYLGKRILTSSGDASEYEIYPVLTDVIHYVFKVTTPPKNGYTIDKIRKVMYDNKIYLYNYSFSNFNVFSEGDATYLEVYIQLPNGNNVLSDDKISKDADGLVIEKVTLSSDTRSELDPSFYNQVSADSADDKFVPYFGNDSFVSSVLPENAIRVYTDEDIELGEFSKGKDYTTYFDILSENKVITGNKITESDTTTLTNTFKEYGFRNSNVNAYSEFVSKLNNYEKQRLTLCKNLDLLRNENQSNCLETKDSAIDVENKFFVYFENENPYVDIVITYNDNNNDIRKCVSYRNNETNYSFIIPVEENMVSVQFPDTNTKFIYW